MRTYPELAREFVDSRKSKNANAQEQIEQIEKTGMRIGERPYGGTWSDVTATEPRGHEAFARICHDIEEEAAAMTKLHIVCGYHPLPGWLNTDLNPRRSDIRLMDATARFTFPDGIF